MRKVGGGEERKGCGIGIVCMLKGSLKTDHLHQRCRREPRHKDRKR